MCFRRSVHNFFRNPGGCADTLLKLLSQVQPTNGDDATNRGYSFESSRSWRLRFTTTSRLIHESCRVGLICWQGVRSNLLSPSQADSLLLCQVYSHVYPTSRANQAFSDYHHVHPIIGFSSFSRIFSVSQNSDCFPLKIRLEPYCGIRASP